jgi:hypothetical protein
LGHQDDDVDDDDEDDYNDYKSDYDYDVIAMWTLSVSRLVGEKAESKFPPTTLTTI